MAGGVTLGVNMIIKVGQRYIEEYEYVSAKVWMDQTADSHIFKFLKNKLSR